MEDYQQINIDNPMRRAFKAGCAGYIPTFEGIPLATECCLPKYSYENLKKLIDRGFLVSKIEVSPNQTVLVTFKGDEQYLATGFCVGGSRSDETICAFAKFLALIEWGGNRAAIADKLTGLVFSPTSEIPYIELSKDYFEEIGPRLFKE